MNEHLGIIYEVATGRIVKNIRMPMRFKVMEHYELRAGQAFLIGVNAIDNNGYKVEEGALVEIEKPSITIEQLRRAAKEEIDRVAGVRRSEVASQGFGQEMTYLAKETEAKAYLADTAPVTAAYPMMAAEIGITAADMQSVAATVLAMADGWRAFAGAIEAVRLGTKQAVDAASSGSEIEMILTTITWPTP